MKFHFTSEENESTKIVWDSLTGPRHKHNEDKVIYFKNEFYALLSVLDGVGSARNNALATKLASDFILENHSCYYSNHNFYLEEMIIELNKTLLNKHGYDNSALTTCAVCIYIFDSKRLVFLTLGDTRIYALGKYYATQITDDDVVYPGSNIITKCLGLELDNNQIRSNSIENFNDNILVCSDGFYKLFEETKLEFFYALNKSRSNYIKNSLRGLVADKNTDDASYVLFKNI